MFSKNSRITKIKEVKDALIIEPSIFEDHRGSIRTIFDSILTKDLNLKSFNHIKLTYSNNNVFRGFHGDTKSWKLIKCVNGIIDQYILILERNQKLMVIYLKLKYLIMKNQ